MDNREWLSLVVGWAVNLVRRTPPEGEVAEVETGILAARALGRPLAWDVLRTRLQLSPSEEKTLSLLIASELSLDLGQLIGHNNGDAQRSSPDVELLQRLIYSRDADAAGRYVRELSPDGTLQRLRLVETTAGRRADETPFLLRQLRVTRRVIEWVHGHLDLDSELTGIARLLRDPAPANELILDPPLEQRTTQLASTLARASEHEASPVLVFAGLEGSGRRSLFRRTSNRLGRPLLIVDCDRLPFDPPVLTRLGLALLRETILHNAVPVLHQVEMLAADGARPDRMRVLEEAFVHAVPGLVGATCPRGQTRPTGFVRGSVVVDVELPRVRDRAALWRRHLGDAIDPSDTDWAATRYTVTGGVIERAARSAIAEATARGEALRREDIHRGIRTTLDTRLSSCARRVVVTQTWADIVLPGETLDEVREIVARVKHRGLVYDEWGLGAKIGKGSGLSVLLSGPPGTGKTMIAGLIANELGLDLYQVDLSQTISKYIGETEKNLAALFDAAEAGHAVLLFDEADSMFAKRTEVKSSTDRYANLEVNFLLQRMETFGGISILTTNLESSIDEAFKRRLSFRIAFPLPEQEERERMWRAMIPPAAKRAPRINFAQLASRFEMSGGYIKNAVVRAAFMAADRGEPIGDPHLLKAATLEYMAMGKVMMHGLR